MIPSQLEVILIHLITALALLLTSPGMPEVPSTWRAGILAVDRETGQVLIDRNSDEYFRPASTVKLITTYLALSQLGPSYVYRTFLMADRENSTLYIVGSGAPLLSAEHVEIMAMETAAAVEQGSSWSLRWDLSRFQDESHCPGWDMSDWNKTYCPPVEGLSVGDNIVQIIVSTLGDSMRIYHYPPLPHLQIENNLRVASRETVTAAVDGWENGFPVITLNGTVLPDTFTVVYKPFAGPPVEFTGMLAEALENTGIRITDTAQGTLPEGQELEVTSTIYSDPLFVLLASMNKWSRNMVAEMVLRAVSMESGSIPASTGSGCDIAGQLLRELVPEGNGIQLADGSGLSRLNLLSPQHLAAVLGSGADSPEWGVEFLATLPVNGVDGTLGSRMTDLPPGSFRGKTGTLNDTSAIAGILTSSSGRSIILVIMLEVPEGYTWTARAWQDGFITWCWENY